MRAQELSYVIPPATSLIPGCALGPYDILAQMAEHGLSDVYRAADSRSNRIVAIKFLGEDVAHDAISRDRLLHDAEEVGAFTHSNVASLLEIGEDEDQGGVYAVYEDVPGTTLEAILTHRHFSPSRAVTLAIQLGETVADIHGAGLVHGDLSPDSVMLTAGGTASILFLGLGGRSSGVAATARAYLAPERLRGETLDERADVFSLGALLARMLTGRAPADGTAPTDIARQVDAELPADLRRLLTSALTRDPAKRCSSAAAFAAELSGVAAVMDLRKR